MRLFLPAALVVLAVLASSPASADPWFGWGENQTEDRYLTGDIDIEDLVSGSVSGRSRGESHESRAGTWVSLGGFLRTYETGAEDVGVMVIAGIAFDRVGTSHARETAFLGDGSSKGSTSGAPPAPPSPSPPAPPPPDAPEPSRVVVTASVTRRAVAAAWRTSGLGVDDARIDSMIARSRASAALPEARVRAMRVFLLDGSQATVIPIDSSSYATAGATLVLEGRLTWRLDRLLYADDEPSLERLRLERQDARSKLAGKVLDALFQWQRAWLAVNATKPGSRENNDATMRLLEAEAGLDVMTGGWFGAWASEVRGGTGGEDPPSPRASP
jgi:hypothetical protein